MFQIGYRPECQHILVRNIGFHTFADVDGFFPNIQAAARVARRDCGVARILIDSSRSMVQSKEMIAAVDRHPRLVPDHCDRLAIVMNSVLTRMQTARLFHDDDTERTFDQMLDALEWLHQGDDRDWRELAAHYAGTDFFS